MFFCNQNRGEKANFCDYNITIVLVEKKDNPVAVEVDADEFNDYEMMETDKERW